MSDSLVKPAVGTADQEVREDDRIFAIPVESSPNLQSLPRFCYRIFEMVAAALALMVFSPLMLIEALVIRLDSPGNPVFLQRRVARSVPVPGRELVDDPAVKSSDGAFRPDGLYWRPTSFRFVKFRTMYADARERFPEWYQYKYSREEFGRECFKREGDPRITRAGHWLRKSTLDELPNFWNVLTGDMALVGPRPELPEILPNYTPEQMRKFTVKPGVTGLAQINGRGFLSYQDTIGWDLKYVETRSIALDLKILVKTVVLVFTRHGAF